MELIINNPRRGSQIIFLIIVASLGYFVDIYDLILFLFVKKASLNDLGIPEYKDTILLNLQMTGMLLGGTIWGILGDKKGRLSTLFFTILIYSIANIANGFVQNMFQYGILRFIAGVGLAGEPGISITLVSEFMSKETRGYGTSIVAGIGIAGAVLGYVVAQYIGWRQAYWLGGILGLMLLIMRVLVHESGMFTKTQHFKISRGNFLSLFTNWNRFIKFIYCILLGVPLWYVIGILVKDAEKFAQVVFHIQQSMEFKDIGQKAVLFNYIGAALGSFIVGFLSEKLCSRKKAIFISLLFLSSSLIIFFLSYGISLTAYYCIIFSLGLSEGYWAVLITMSSEQFGINLRATVATTVPNIIRGTIVIVSLGYETLGDATRGLSNGAIIMGGIAILSAFFAASRLKETYGKELDYLEPMV